MTPEQFVYWLQGFMEMTDSKMITVKQLDMIKAHLNTVFKKETHKLFDIPDVLEGPKRGKRILDDSVLIC